MTLLTTKQELILFFIFSEFARDQKRIIHVFERYNSKEKIEFDKNLQPLLDNGFIVDSELKHYATPFYYSITELGKKYVTEVIKEDEILTYVSKMSNPELIYKIIEVLIERKNSL